MAASVVLSRKLGADHSEKKSVSAAMLDEARYLPELSSAEAVSASAFVTEKVDWKPSWSEKLEGMGS